MDYGKAFSFVFDDEAWISKVIIGGLLTASFILIIPVFIVLGYSEQVAKRAMLGEKGLPEWKDWGDLLKRGFSLSVVFFVYMIPAYVFILIPVIGLFVLGAVADGGGSDALGGLAVLLILMAYAVFFIFIILFNLLMPAIVAQFVRTDSIGETLNILNLFTVVKNNFVNILILVAFSMVAGFVAQIGLIACFIGVFFTGFYAQLMLYNLYGQFAKTVEEEKTIGSEQPSEA